MTDKSTPATKPMDRVVLARLTGDLGDAKTIARICGDVAGLQTALLPETVSQDMQLTIEAEYLGYQSGLRSDLISGLDQNHTLSSVEIRGWCPHFVIAVRNDLPIAMIAQLLGDTGSDNGEMRALSTIEADVANLLLAKVAGVLRKGLTVEGAGDAALSAPYKTADYAHQSADIADNFAAATRLQIQLGKLVSEVIIVIPQSILLKTTITRPGKLLTDGSHHQNEAVADHVLRSQVDLSARIRLTPLKLSTIARLRPGDVIPFEDVGEIGVDMDANGKMMYRCEFGRSGDSYSVKVKSNASSDNNILKQVLDL